MQPLEIQNSLNFSTREGDPQLVFLVFACDDAFSMPMTVSIYSALKRLDRSRKVSVYILDGGISPTNINKIRTCISDAHPLLVLEFFRPSTSLLETFPTNRNISSAAYLRILIPQIIPDDVERVLYLDSDTITTQDISELFDFDMGDTPCFAVRDKSDKEAARLMSDFSSVNFNGNTKYFNSGVILINMPIWRRDRISDRTLEVLESRPDLCYYHDQCALNVAVEGRWAELPTMWNNQIAGNLQVFIEVSQVPNEQGILHFQTRKKPWLGSRACLFEDRYLLILLKMPWLSPLQKLKILARYLLIGMRRDASFIKSLLLPH